MNHSRPALHASRIFYLPSERDHKANDGPPTPGTIRRIGRQGKSIMYELVEEQ